MFHYLTYLTFVSQGTKMQLHGLYVFLPSPMLHNELTIPHPQLSNLRSASVDHIPRQVKAICLVCPSFYLNFREI